MKIAFSIAYKDRSRWPIPSFNAVVIILVTLIASMTYGHAKWEFNLVYRTQNA